MKGNEEDEVFMPNANVIRERRHKQIELYGTMIFLWGRERVMVVVRVKVASFVRALHHHYHTWRD